jgi:hypothetical protein
MNFVLNGAPMLMLVVPVVVWLVALYLILRFLRAFERGIYAHERIADALTKSPRGPQGHASMSVPPNER